MKVCFACKKELDDSDTYLNAFKLDKEGIANLELKRVNSTLCSNIL